MNEKQKFTLGQRVRLFQKNSFFTKVINLEKCYQ